jgi:DNA-directed RNA polymerase subunit K/omega
MASEHQDLQTAESERAPEITSRFLFVDVAAQRAKQLRRGALPRIDRLGGGPHKLERVAMEEVKSGLIDYTLPVMADIASARAAALLE